MSVSIESARLLFDHGYWATSVLLEKANGMALDEWASGTAGSERSVREGLVHCLDTERSWRQRLRGEPDSAWRSELSPADFASAADLRSLWNEDEREMREWLATLDDSALAQMLDLGPRNIFDLGTFLLHMALHSAHQRGEVALLLTRLGLSPGDLDYLDFIDWQAAQAAGE